MSPVVVLHELDKRPDSTGDTGLSLLIGALEPASATRFQDAYVWLPESPRFLRRLIHLRG
jgi:ATP-dependent Lon protease